MRLQDESNFVITIMAGTDIHLPTLAERILQLKRAQTAGLSEADQPLRRTTVITLMGGTSFLSPTIAEEIEEMMKLRQSAVVSDAELFQLWQTVVKRGEMDTIETFTLMGWAGEEKPSAKDEMKDLKRIATRGYITPQEYQELQGMLRDGLSSQQRASVLQQKIYTLLTPPQTNRTYSTNPFENQPREGRTKRMVEHE